MLGAARSTLVTLLLALLFLAYPSGAVGAQELPATGEPERAEDRAIEGARRPAGPSLVVLVRHAERAGPSASDPGLTATGEARALALARLLGGAGITRIHTSDTRRARETAAPLAQAEGISIELYDPRELEAFANRLAMEPGRHLVVGHSNTTDELSQLLGGKSFGEIVEEWEYDRLYLLTPSAHGDMETVLLRFGPEVRRPTR